MPFRDADILATVERLSRARGDDGLYLDGCEKLLDAVYRNLGRFTDQEKKSIDTTMLLLVNLKELRLTILREEHNISTVSLHTRHHHSNKAVLKWVGDDATVAEEIIRFWDATLTYPPLQMFVDYHLRGMYAEGFTTLTASIMELLGVFSVRLTEKYAEDQRRNTLGSGRKQVTLESLGLPMPDVPVAQVPAELLDFGVKDIPPEPEKPKDELQGYVPFYEEGMSFFSFISKNKAKAKKAGIMLDRMILGDYYRLHHKKARTI
jgi:hypothetical protein